VAWASSSAAADSAAERRSTTTRPSSPELAIDAGNRCQLEHSCTRQLCESFWRSLWADLAMDYGARGSLFGCYASRRVGKESERGEPRTVACDLGCSRSRNDRADLGWAGLRLRTEKDFATWTRKAWNPVKRSVTQKAWDPVPRLAAGLQPGHEKRPGGPCLGRRSGTKHWCDTARWLSGPFRAMLCRARWPICSSLIALHEDWAASQGIKSRLD
jgi:hypothetical protein